MARVWTRLGSPRPESFFLVVAIVFGLLLMAVTPLLQIPDEQSHFFRAYQLAEFQLKSSIVKNGAGVGGSLPTSLQSVSHQLQGTITEHPSQKFNLDKLRNLSKIPVNRGVRTEVQFEGAALYSPAPYLPQIVAIETGRVVHLRVIALMYWVRLVNFAVWVALVFVAIRLIPAGKWALTTLALLPMSLEQAASMSADAFTSALAFLTLAMFASFATRTRRLGKRELATILVVTALLSLSKTAFLPFCLLFLLIPSKQFEDRKHHLCFIAALLVVNVGLELAWTEYVRDLVPYMARVFRPGVPIDYNMQLKLVLHHPFGYLYTLFNTMFGVGSAQLYRGVIGIFGWSDTPLPLWAVIVGYASLAAVFLMEALAGTNHWLSNRQRVLTGVLYLAMVGLVATILYLTVTPIGQNHIDGLQGRYFLAPIALLIPALIFRKPGRGARKWGPRSFYPTMVIIVGLLVVSVVVICQRFYA